MSTAEGLERARLTVDLGAVVANWRDLGRLAPGAEVAAVVKADAYGLGLAPVARALARAGCRSFFVARLEEGEALRALLAEPRIFVLDGLAGRPPARFLETRLVPVLGEPAELALWRATARRVERRLETAILLDTGLTRLGFSAEEVASLAPDAFDGLALVLVASHLACADEPDHPLNRRQWEAFVALRARLPAAPAGLAASSGIFLGPDFHFDQVRPGAALYGVNPTPGRPNPMRPVVRLEAPVLKVHAVREPGSVGYGATWPTAAGARIAVVPVGYADGWPRAASSRGRVRIDGCEVPIVGRVSMDLLTLDVSDLPAERVRPGTPVELLSATFGVDELARAASTIGYEILTRLGRRFERRWLEPEGLA
ncbi:MAG: alanine racemase [Geminicoccaceae bacterium]|nr:MAG: alanine racemase [Geminicoccaceae bacterium]